MSNFQFPCRLNLNLGHTYCPICILELFASSARSNDFDSNCIACIQYWIGRAVLNENVMSEMITYLKHKVIKIMLDLKAM